MMARRRRGGDGTGTSTVPKDYDSWAVKNRAMFVP